MLSALSAFLVLISLFAVLRKRILKRKKLPPGPQGLPIIGNLLQLPKAEAWKYHGGEMFEKYGDVVYMEALGQPLVILNSYSAANDLFFKRSSIYSDRPRFPVCGGLMGADLATSLAPYGPLWRTHRRMWHQYFGPKSMDQYHARVQTEARTLVTRLFENDRNACIQLKLWIVKCVVGAIFGIKINSLEDELVVFTEQVNQEGAESLVPGKYLADIFPLLVHVPEWFPGAGWKRWILVLRDRLIKMRNVPYDITKAAVLSGDTTPTFVSSMMEDTQADEVTKKWISATAYGTGVDTILGLMTRFVFTMMMHPEIQRRAQEEIDAVTGGHRLPTTADKASLPYIDAIIQELHRWEIIGPVSVPHRAVQDDEYRGYIIPKGSMMIPNIWRISRDPELYPDPDEFKPERFLNGDFDKQPMDPRLYSFGIGRRICPGRHFADAVMYIGIATLLATCDISKPLDENGKEYVPEFKLFGETVRGVEPIEARVQPRSAQAVELLHGSLSNQ